MPLLVASWAVLCSGMDGFYVHPDLPDGNYRIKMHENEAEEPSVMRWEEISQDWISLPATVRGLTTRKEKKPVYMDENTGVFHYDGQPPKTD